MGGHAEERWDVLTRGRSPNAERRDAIFAAIQIMQRKWTDLRKMKEKE